MLANKKAYKVLPITRGHRMCVCPFLKLSFIKRQKDRRAQINQGDGEERNGLSHTAQMKKDGMINT